MELSSLSPDVDTCACEVAPEAIPGIMGFSSVEVPRTTIHLIESNAAARASAFRLFSELGYHCEIYSTVDELMNFQPTSGILLVHEEPDGALISEALRRTREVGLPLMLVGCAKNPTTEMVVAAMHKGAQFYFELPFDPRKMEPALASLSAKSKAEQRSLELRAAARAKTERLSPREREVIGFVVEGHSNKSIARLLGLSPRTVEIHRTKAMSRLDVQNSSEAVRTWLIGNGNL